MSETHESLIVSDPTEPFPDWHLLLPEWANMGAESGLDVDAQGRVTIVFGDGDDYYDDGEPPTEAMLAHVAWLVEHHDKLMSTVLLETALRLYKGRRIDVLEPDEDDDFLPVRSRPEEMIPLVRPTQIHLTTLPGVDLPYVGVRLLPYWDCEHDLGILCLGMEVVDVTGDQHIDASSAKSHHDALVSGMTPGVTLVDPDGYEIS